MPSNKPRECLARFTASANPYKSLGGGEESNHSWQQATVQERWLRGIINRFSLKYHMRVQTNPEDIGRCGCGRREYCDGSHGLTEAQWQQVQAKEREAAQKNTSIAEQDKDAH